MFLFTVILPLFSVLGVQSASTSKKCRCLSTDACWPSAQEVSAFASQLSQPLLRPLPPAAGCYDSSNGNCTDAQQLWDDGNWRAAQPGAMQSPNFQNYIFTNGTIDACYPNATLGSPCKQGSVPVLAIDARTPEDVQAAVKFAAAHNLRVSVKTSGHDFMGRSTARGSFLIWTRNMQNITFNSTFVPDGTSESTVLENVITLGAGVSWKTAYTAADTNGRMLVGGSSAGGSVGAAGGWIQGGGHNAPASTFGLGVDNVVQFTIVTSDGEFRTANAYQNKDLFWALRGGGGGSWGVVTSVSYQTHPKVPIITATFSTMINTTIANGSFVASPVLKQLFTEFVRITPSLVDGRWGGYAFAAPAVPDTGVAMQFFFIAPNVTWEAANATMLPFFDYANQLAANSSIENGGKLTVVYNNTSPMESIYTWQQSLFLNATGQVGANLEIGSWLIPKDVVENDHEKLANTLLEVPGLQYYLVAGGAVSEVDPDSTGLNPAWRKALVITETGVGWEDGASAAEINGWRELLKWSNAKMRSAAPESGAYVNEASLYEPDFKYAFFGTHYDKLRAIKKKYDPIDLFVVAQGIASDEWDAELNCRV